MSLVRLVEDDVVVTSLVTQALEREGHRVISTVNAHSLFDPFFWDSVDVCITDQMLGAQEVGTDLLAWLEVACPHVKRVLFTAVPMSVLTDAQKRHAQRVLQKPASLDDLVGVIG